jgi:small GTP-binding protein
MSDKRSGSVALAGRPNVGKSTLLNALIGQKLSIVTPRPQTTRQRLIGLMQSPEAQVAFIDTPGLHLGQRRALNRAMNRTAAGALADADLVLFVLEALKWTDEDEAALARIRERARSVIAVVNKADRVRPRERLLPYLQQLGARHDFKAIVPISALKGHNLEQLRAVIVAALPVGEPMFPLDQITDRSVGVSHRRDHSREAHAGARRGAALRRCGRDRADRAAAGWPPGGLGGDLGRSRGSQAHRDWRRGHTAQTHRAGRAPGAQSSCSAARFHLTLVGQGARGLGR